MKIYLYPLEKAVIDGAAICFGTERAAVEAILDNRLLKPYGILVLESGEPDPLGKETPLLAKFDVLKSARYGAAYVTILSLRA